MISPNIAKYSAVFIALSVLSLGMLFTSFAFPLQNLEVWKKREFNKLGQPNNMVFIITDADAELEANPQLNKSKAVKIYQITQDYKYQKFALLTMSLIFSSIAVLLADKAIEFQKMETHKAKLDVAVKKVEARMGERLYLFNKIKQQWRLLSQAQKNRFIQELMLIIEFIEKDKKGIKDKITEITPPETRTIDVKGDKFIEASYLLDNGNDINTAVCKTWKVALGTKEHSEIKQKFVEWLKD